MLVLTFGIDYRKQVNPLFIDGHIIHFNEGKWPEDSSYEEKATIYLAGDRR